MGRKVRIGLIQVDQGEELYEERLNILENMARKCYEDGADLVFFPEAYQHVPDRSIRERPEELREKFNSWKARCVAMAKEFHAYIVPWDYEPTPEGVYNCSYILDRNGIEVGKYHKVNLTRGELEWNIVHGEDFPVFDLDFGRVGIMICFDNYFPESARILGNRGAELVLYPLYGDTLVPEWELKMKARAVDNSMYVASCQIDNNTKVAYCGIVDPHGNVVAKLDEYPSYKVVEIDLGAPVYTNTANVHGQRELIREYLKKCRYSQAYSGILEVPPDIKEWDEICETGIN